MILSTHAWLQRRLLPIYLVSGSMLVFFPYVYGLGYLCFIVASAIWMLERTRQQLERHIDLRLTQYEELLFVGDESRIVLVVDGVDELDRLGLPLRVRLKSSSGISFPAHERLPNVLDYEVDVGRARHELVVRAEYRGPAMFEECVIAVTLPFRLGTYLYERPIDTEWTVLPSLLLHPPVGTKRLALGDRPLLASPLRNPLQLIGSKPYEGEPVKEIDWYATAKLGRLQSKVFQQTTLDTFTFALDLTGPSGYTLHHDFESLISQTAFVTSRLLKEDCKIELFLNRFNEDGTMLHVPLQEGERGIRFILLQLATIHPGNRFISTDAFTRMVERKRLKQSHLVWFNQHNLYD